MVQGQVTTAHCNSLFDGLRSRESHFLIFSFLNFILMSSLDTSSLAIAASKLRLRLVYLVFVLTFSSLRRLVEVVAFAASLDSIVFLADSERLEGPIKGNPLVSYFSFWLTIPAKLSASISSIIV